MDHPSFLTPILCQPGTVVYIFRLAFENYLNLCFDLNFLFVLLCPGNRNRCIFSLMNDMPENTAKKNEKTLKKILVSYLVSLSGLTQFIFP